MTKIRKLIVIIFALILGLTMVGCSKEKDAEMLIAPKVALESLSARSVNHEEFDSVTSGDKGYSYLPICIGEFNRNPYLVIDKNDEEVFLKVQLYNPSGLEIKGLQIISTDTEALLFQDGVYQELSELTTIKWDNSSLFENEFEEKIYKLKLPSDDTNTKITIEKIEYIDIDQNICEGNVRNRQTIVVVKTNWITINISTIDEKKLVSFDLSNTEMSDEDASIFAAAGYRHSEYFWEKEKYLGKVTQDVEYELSPGNYIIKAKCNVMGYNREYLQYFTISN
ncbi:MAG: hypothetical protein WCR33_04045 [Bacilli bacterium]